MGGSGVSMYVRPISPIVEATPTLRATAFFGGASPGNDRSTDTGASTSGVAAGVTVAAARSTLVPSRAGAGEERPCTAATVVPPPAITTQASNLAAVPPSSGESSVNSTPQLGHPHFSLRTGFAHHHVQQQQHPHQQQHEPPHVAANFAQYMQQPLDDPRLSAALAMCDPYATGQLTHLIGHANGVSQ